MNLSIIFSRAILVAFISVSIFGVFAYSSPRAEAAPFDLEAQIKALMERISSLQKETSKEVKEVTTSLKLSSEGLVVTAEGVVTIKKDGVEVCGPTTKGTLNWGDDKVESISGLGCSGVVQKFSVTHTYAKAGTYVVTVSDGIKTVSKKVTVPGKNSDTKNKFTIKDVKSITYKYIDPNPMMADEEYFLYTIKLNRGKSVSVKMCGFCQTESRYKAFTDAGFTGNVAALLKLAKKETPAVSHTTFNITVPTSVEVGSTYTLEWKDGATGTIAKMLKAYPNATAEIIAYKDDAFSDSGIGQTVARKLNAQQILAKKIEWKVKEKSNDGRAMPKGKYSIAMYVTVPQGEDGGKGVGQANSEEFNLTTETIKPISEVYAKITASDLGNAGAGNLGQKVIFTDGTSVPFDTLFPLTKNGKPIVDAKTIANGDNGMTAASRKAAPGLIVRRLNGEVRLVLDAHHATKTSATGVNNFEYITAQLQIQGGEFVKDSLKENKDLGKHEKHSASSTISQMKGRDTMKMEGTNKVIFSFFADTGSDAFNVKYKATPVPVAAVQGASTTNALEQIKNLMLAQLLELKAQLISPQ